MHIKSIALANADRGFNFLERNLLWIKAVQRCHGKSASVACSFNRATPPIQFGFGDVEIMENGDECQKRNRYW